MTDSIVVRMATAGGILRIGLDAHADTEDRPSVELPGRTVLCLEATRDHAILCGTGHGLVRWTPGGGWLPAEGPLGSARVTALASNGAGAGTGTGTVWAGTEPSAVFRSEDGGRSWTQTTSLDTLPSSSEWSYPPRPDTHHVRTLAPHPEDPDRILVGIEAGAVVRSLDGGETWVDRRPGGPRDPHVLLPRSDRPGAVLAAAGDGWFETEDFGERWERTTAGLADAYVWDVALDERDDVAVAVSAPDAARAHGHDGAESHVHRRLGSGVWEEAETGLPQSSGRRAPFVAPVPGGGKGFVLTTRDARLYRSDARATRWSGPVGSWPEDDGPAEVRDILVTRKPTHRDDAR